MEAQMIRKIILASLLLFLAAPLFIFIYGRYLEDKERDLASSVIYNPDWPGWMNKLNSILEKNPKYKCSMEPDVSKMVHIPKGGAWVGCNPGKNKEILCAKNTLPYGKIFLKDFYIDKTPVSEAEYDLCVKEHLCLPPVSTVFSSYYSGQEYPVIVDFARAQRYCFWLGKRLPTEEEWEKAARGVDGRLYPWGDTPPDHTRGNICDKNCKMDWAEVNMDDGYPYISPIGSFPAGQSPYGLLDVVGNVKVWVADRAIRKDVRHVAKGSSWYSALSQVALHERQIWQGGIRLDDKSVRCAADY